MICSLLVKCYLKISLYFALFCFIWLNHCSKKKTTEGRKQ